MDDSLCDDRHAALIEHAVACRQYFGSTLCRDLAQALVTTPRCGFLRAGASAEAAPCVHRAERVPTSACEHRAKQRAPAGACAHRAEQRAPAGACAHRATRTPEGACAHRAEHRAPAGACAHRAEQRAPAGACAHRAQRNATTRGPLLQTRSSVRLQPRNRPRSSGQCGEFAHQSIEQRRSSKSRGEFNGSCTAMQGHRHNELSHRCIIGRFPDQEWEYNPHLKRLQSTGPSGARFVSPAVLGWTEG